MYKLLFFLQLFVVVKTEQIFFRSFVRYSLGFTSLLCVTKQLLISFLSEHSSYFVSRFAFRLRHSSIRVDPEEYQQDGEHEERRTSKHVRQWQKAESDEEVGRPVYGDGKARGETARTNTK